MPIDQKDLVGSQVGPYRVLEVIGEGGMGVVYKGVHEALDQRIAIKALTASLSMNSGVRERFHREARIQATLSHPNIVSLLILVEENGSSYLVMEFIEGQTLESLIRQIGLIPPERAVAISLQLLDALAFAHAHGVIHRDVKPSNIMITDSGVAKVTDFGIAKFLGEKRHTATGVRPGTLWYMSPEQVRGGDLDARSDIYSFGITFYEMLTGRVPFDAESEYEVMRSHVELDPPSPRNYYPHIPEPLEYLILKCLAKNPDDRFQSIQEVSESLRSPDTLTVIASERSAFEKVTPIWRKLKSSIPYAALPQPPRYLLLGGGLLSIVVLLAILMSSTGQKGVKLPRAPVSQVPVQESLEAPGETIDSVESEEATPDNSLTNTSVTGPQPETLREKPVQPSKGGSGQETKLPSLPSPPRPDPSEIERTINSRLISLGSSVHAVVDKLNNVTLQGEVHDQREVGVAREAALEIKGVQGVTDKTVNIGKAEEELGKAFREGTRSDRKIR